MTVREVRLLALCGVLVLNAVIVWRHEHPRLPSVDCGMAGGLMRGPW